MGSAAALVEGLGIAVFALSGALVAARKGMDPVGFAMLAVVTGVGGGSLRDVLLGQPVFWVVDPRDPLIAVGVALAAFGVGRHLDAAPLRARARALLWADALGLAIFAVTGARKALALGAHPVTAVVLGTLTATFGGILRDLLAGEPTLVLHREIYVTAAVLGASAFVLLARAGVPPEAAGALGIAAGFGLRALALRRDWSLPSFRPPAR